MTQTRICNITSVCYRLSSSAFLPTLNAWPHVQMRSYLLSKRTVSLRVNDIKAHNVSTLKNSVYSFDIKNYTRRKDDLT